MSAIANRRSVKLEGPDYYPTPVWAIEAFLEKENFKGDITEPCCGEGYMADALEACGYKVHASDLYCHGYGTSNIDARDIKAADNIITNPPYNIASELLPLFLKASRNKVALLMRLAFLESKKRHPLFKEFPPARVYIFPERLSFAPAGVVIKGGGTISHGWIVWDKSHKGPTELHWLEVGHKRSGMK